VQAADKALVAGGCEGGTPHQGVPETVVEGAEPCAAYVKLARIAAPLVARHLSGQKRTLIRFKPCLERAEAPCW
jgi:hypothetical protein